MVLRGRELVVLSWSDPASSWETSEADEKWGRREDKLILIVDQAVSGRVDAEGNDNGRCRSGGLVIFNAGSLYREAEISMDKVGIKYTELKSSFLSA